MQPLVQSAIDAANRGENNKAMEFLKQALAANPNDVDAWLVVAAIVEQPERKRQCLNRVLTLDPTNQIARDELLEMDRAAMGGAPPFVPGPVADTRQGTPPQPTYQPAPPPPSYPSSTSAFESAPAPKQSAPVASQAQIKAAPKPSPKTRSEKPEVFKTSLFWRILMYFFIVFFGCLALLIASQEIASSLPFFLMAFLMGIGAMALSKKVEISETGLRASGVLSSSEVRWSDIKSMKSSSMKQRLELVKSNGQVIKVSTQVSGYPRIVEIIRQKRPDLFGIAASGYEQAPSGSYGSPVPAPAFTGTKTFRKSFIKQYGINFVTIFFCLLFALLSLEDQTYRAVTLGTGAFCLLILLFTVFQVSAIKVEPNKLTIESLFEQKAFSARQIREIKMQSVRGRYGRVTNFVVIVPAEGKKYPVGGFAEGEEIIYGFLTNWWDAYRNR